MVGTRMQYDQFAASPWAKQFAHGGSIPIAPEIIDALDATVAVMGFALPGANMHAPDEWFPVEHLELGMMTVTRLYERLAEVS